MRYAGRRNHTHITTLDMGIDWKFSGFASDIMQRNTAGVAPGPLRQMEDEKMWKIFNWLFRWEYVLVKTCNGLMVCRCITTASGLAAIVYGTPRLMKRDGTFLVEDYCQRWFPLTYGIKDYNKETP